MSDPLIAMVTPLPYRKTERGYPVTIEFSQRDKVLRAIRADVKSGLNDLADNFNAEDEELPYAMSILVANENGKLRSKKELTELINDTVVSLMSQNMPANVAEFYMPVAADPRGARVSHAVSTVRAGDYDEDFARVELIDWLQVFYLPLDI